MTYLEKVQDKLADLSPDSLRILLEYEEGERKRQAKKVFYEDLLKFQIALQPVVKNTTATVRTKEGSHYQFDYLTDSDLYTHVVPILNLYNFSYRFEYNSICRDVKIITKKGESIKDAVGEVTVSCCVMHTQGHVEKTTLSAVPTYTSLQNMSQSVRSILTSLCKWTFIAVLGVISSDETTDEANGDAEVQDARVERKRETQPPYPDETFGELLPIWKENYQEQKITFEEILARMNSRGIPSSRQLATLKKELEIV